MNWLGCAMQSPLPFPPLFKWSISNAIVWPITEGKIIYRGINMFLVQITKEKLDRSFGIY